jgi:Sec-independent protein secretion pathway component TatC
MALPELLLALVLGLGGVVVLVLTVVVGRGREPGPPVTSRPPLPLLPISLALLTVFAAPLLGMGLGGVVTERLLLPVFSGLGSLALTTPPDPTWARLRGGGLLTLWLALPGLLATAWLLLARARSWQGASLLGALGWLGFGGGLAVGRWLVLPAALSGMSSPGPELAVALDDVVAMATAGMLALGVAGASGPVVWMLAGSSRRALRRMLQATAVMPAGALALGALTTPPDVVSQLVVAAMLGLCWLAGLAAGAVTMALRRG